MTTRYYEDPSGYFRNIDVPVDTKAEREYAEAQERDFRAILLPHKARGAITENDYPKWKKWLAQDREVAAGALESPPSHEAVADRAFADDPEINALADAFDEYMGVAAEDRVRRYGEHDALPQSERQYLELVRLTGGRR